MRAEAVLRLEAAPGASYLYFAEVNKSKEIAEIWIENADTGEVVVRTRAKPKRDW